jgi:hypothetical protein
MAYRILSLDGGGVRSLLQVRALQGVYGERTGHQVLDQFDFVAATGGGCVVLVGLLLDWTLAKIREELYEAQGRYIFAPKPSFLRKVFVSAKYSTPDKLDHLRSLLGSHGARQLSTLSIGLNKKLPTLLICAYDRDRNRAEFFRSDIESKSASASRFLANESGSPAAEPDLLHIVNASTATPPDKFHPPAKIGTVRFCDGAAGGFYNPVLAAVTEALANKEDPKGIRVLSLGSGTIQRPSQGNATNGEAVSIYSDPPEVSTYVAHVMLGLDMPRAEKRRVVGSIVRMSPVAHPRTKDKGLSQDVLQSLAGFAVDAVERDNFKLLNDFGDEWINGKVFNQPIRASRNNICEIGHLTFQEAKEHWLSLTP